MIDKMTRFFIFGLCLVGASWVRASDLPPEPGYIKLFAKIMEREPPQLVNYRRDKIPNSVTDDFDSTYEELIAEQFCPADALLFAAIREDMYLGDEKCLRLCQEALEKGANKEKTLEGQTALMHAASGGNIKVMALLLEMGANINARSDEGEDVLTVAMKAPNALVQTAIYLMQEHAHTSNEHIALANELAIEYPGAGWDRLNIAVKIKIP